MFIARAVPVFILRPVSNFFHFLESMLGLKPGKNWLKNCTKKIPVKNCLFSVIGAVTCLNASQDGNLLSGGEDRVVKAWHSLR